MTGREPSQWEQDVAAAYVNERPLYRPGTRLRHAIIFVSTYLAVSILATSLAVVALGYAASRQSTSSLLGFTVTHSVLTTAIVYGLVCLLGVGVGARFIVIGTVRLYQHYAPEQIRRRCQFQPTCSEYAILSVSKYGAVKGCMKTLLRVRYRCRGTTYRIDYP